MYLIEKNIPIPPSDRGHGNSNRLYPFADMVPGDSFAVPLVRRNAVNAAVCRALKEFPGHKYVIRNMNDVVRIWRVA